MKRFKKIYIEITNVCNLKCDFCPKSSRKPEYMSIELFTYILDQIKDYTDYIYLHVKGEPLLHPDIGRLLDLSHEKGFKVNITTNGTLINRVKDILIKKPGIRQINFSLHSFDGNEMKLDKKEYINNIIGFIKEANGISDIIISMRLWNLEENSVSNAERKRNKDILEIIEREFNLSYRIQEKVQPSRGIMIADRVYLNHEYQFQWPDLSLDEDNGLGFCYGLRNQLAILVDGTVVPCCLDGEGVINLGNIKTNYFSDIIENERARKIYEGFSNRLAVEELCRKCGYRKRFGLV